MKVRIPLSVINNFSFSSIFKDVWKEYNNITGTLTPKQNDQYYKDKEKYFQKYSDRNLCVYVDIDNQIYDFFKEHNIDFYPIFNTTIYPSKDNIYKELYKENKKERLKLAEDFKNGKYNRNQVLLISSRIVNELDTKKHIKKYETYPLYIDMDEEIAMLFALKFS